MKGHGGKRKGSGNKPGVPIKGESELRTIRKVYRFSPDERQTIKEAVLMSGIEESKIVREGALKEAQRLIENGS